MMDFLLGIRWMHTLRKLPRIRPNRNENIFITGPESILGPSLEMDGQSRQLQHGEKPCSTPLWN